MAAVAPIRRQVQVSIGKASLPVGSLVYVRQGRREHCAFAYDAAWLANPARFNVSADLQLMPDHQPRGRARAGVGRGLALSARQGHFARRHAAQVHAGGRGWLAIGKFPSVGDTRSVTRADAVGPRVVLRAG